MKCPFYKRPRMEMHSRPFIFRACPFGYTRKHEVSAIKQLKEILVQIRKHYAGLHQDYFAAVVKGDLARFTIDKEETIRFIL